MSPVRKPCSYWPRGLWLVLGLWLLAAPALAEHPLALVDYAPQSRLSLEMGGGRLKNPLSVTTLSYRLSFEIEAIERLHVRLGVPFMSYKGAQGSDTFIRGNILLGLSYAVAPTDWLTLGSTLDLYTPTYQRAKMNAVSLPQDPRRAILINDLEHFGYALAERFPITPSLALGAHGYGVYAAAEFGGSYTPAVRGEAKRRQKQMGFVHYGLALGYNLLDYVEFRAAVWGLVDPSQDAHSMKELLGLSYKSPRTTTTVVVGPRLQYGWAALAFQVGVPLESDLRRLRGPAYSGAFTAQF